MVIPRISPSYFTVFVSLSHFAIFKFVSEATKALELGIIFISGTSFTQIQLLLVIPVFILTNRKKRYPKKLNVAAINGLINKGIKNVDPNFAKLKSAPTAISPV